jgi:hypothetical protein
VQAKIKKEKYSQCKMDGMKVEPVSEEEIHSTDIGIHHTDMNQEEPEPMNFIEVKCEVEVSTLFET